MRLEVWAGWGGEEGEEYKSSLTLTQARFNYPECC